MAGWFSGRRDECQMPMRIMPLAEQIHAVRPNCFELCEAELGCVSERPVTEAVEDVVVLGRVQLVRMGHDRVDLSTQFAVWNRNGLPGAKLLAPQAGISRMVARQP
jgi:hypothetical protein